MQYHEPASFAFSGLVLFGWESHLHSHGGALQVTGIYSASSWRHISEHLHDILGKQCAELGDTQGALRHCTALLDCGHRLAAAQMHYMGRFLEAVQAAGVTGVSEASCGSPAWKHVPPQKVFLFLICVKHHQLP